MQLGELWTAGLGQGEEMISSFFVCLAPQGQHLREQHPIVKVCYTTDGVTSVTPFDGAEGLFFPCVSLITINEI